AWLGDGSDVLTGKVRCALTTAEIGSSETSISMNLTNATCALAEFSNAGAQDTSTYPGEVTFKSLELSSCLNPIGVTTGMCDGTTLERKQGESTSLRLVIPGVSTFGVTLPNLVTGCRNLPSMNSSVFATNYRLPAGGSLVKLPSAILGYEKIGCIEETNTYRMPDGLSGVEGVSRLITTSTTTNHTMIVADNYVGVTGSPFHMAQANNKIILPNINCGGTCLNAGPGPVNYNKDFDQMRDRIWRLFGSPDLTDSKDYVPSADAVLTVANNNGGSLLLQNIQNDGVFGNTGILTFI